MSDLQQTLQEALQVAGNVLMRHYGRLEAIGRKGEIDLVTIADRESEAAIKELICARFPSHAIIAEESGEVSGDEFTWIIDPLDGTTNFAHSFPLFSISIAVLCRHEAAVAGVYNPFYRELYMAQRGSGATLNGEPIQVSKVASLRDSLMVTGFPYDRRERMDHYLAGMRQFLDRSQGVLRLGSAALDLCAVACGRLEGFWEEKLNAWDTAAGWLIVEEAGGRVSNFTGGHFDPFGAQVLATNGLVHEECIDALRPLSTTNP
ncbi:MAG: inositol monophosphatase family protein [Candidatus Sumerlaeaceae bacterium]